MNKLGERKESSLNVKVCKFKWGKTKKKDNKCVTM